MSWRTTAVFFVLLLAAVGFYLWQTNQSDSEPAAMPATAVNNTVTLFEGVTISSVNRLDISRAADGTAVSYFRDAIGGWTQMEPAFTEVLSPTMNTQVTGFINIRSTRTLSAEENPLSAYGLDPPGHEITMVTLRSDGQTIRHTLLVGHETATGSGYYVQKSGDPRIYIVPPGAVNNMVNLIDAPPLPTPTPAYP